MKTETKRLGRMFSEAYMLWVRGTYGALEAGGFAEIRPSHSPVFRHISPEGSRVVDLAAAAGLKKQSMAYLVNDLESAGYVSMSPDPNDGRARLVRLTPRGEEASAALAENSIALENRFGSIIGHDKIETLRALMADLLAADDIGPDASR